MSLRLTCDLKTIRLTTILGPDPKIAPPALLSQPPYKLGGGTTEPCPPDPRAGLEKCARRESAEPQQSPRAEIGGNGEVATR